MRWMILALVAAFTSALAEEAPQRFAELDRCALSNGASIESCRIGYRVYGKPNRDRSNIVLFPTWYNGQTKDMETLVGPGRMLDTDRYQVITIDALGDGASSSPSNGSARQRGVNFPGFTIADMVEAEHRFATSHLGAAHVHAVVGISMGGMQAYEWAMRYPGYMDTMIAIAGTPWLTSADRLTWQIMRVSILNDPAYQQGRYRDEPPLALANEIDTLFAYSPVHIARTVSAGDFAGFVTQTDGQPTIGANNRVWQIEAVEHQNVLRDRAPEELGRLELPNMLVVVARYDHTVNPAPSIEWAHRTHARLLVLDDDCGHMSLVCAPEAVIKAVRAKLAEARRS